MNGAPLKRPYALRRSSTMRRALVGTAWALAWTLAWGGALLVFHSKTKGGPSSLAMSDGPASLPIRISERKRLESQLAASELRTRMLELEMRRHVVEHASAG